MSPDEQPEGQPAPAAKSPASPAEGDRRRSSRRPRFRGRRGGGGRSPSRPPVGDQPLRQEPDAPTSKAPGTIRDAIAQVEKIQSELEQVLEETNEVLRILEQAEREKTASDDEIDHLREALRRLHRDRGGSPRPSPSRSFSPAPPPADTPPPPVDREEPPEDEPEE
jgi:hypothetical protein